MPRRQRDARETRHPHFAAATRSHRLFLQLQDLMVERAAQARRVGSEVCLESRRTVGARFRRTRIRVYHNGNVVLELVYRCDGGLVDWPDPERSQLQDRTAGARFYALTFRAGDPKWSSRPDGRGPHRSNEELCNGWLVPLT